MNRVPAVRRLLFATVLTVGVAALSSATADATPLQLPGLGASKKTWQHTHRIDRRPKLAKGCCYLPRVKSTSGGTSLPTWSAVQFGDPPKQRVLSYMRNFGPGVNETIALATLKRQDLPRDAVVAWEKV